MSFYHQCYESRNCEKKFTEVHELFKQGKNKKNIAKALDVSRTTVIEWLKTETYQETRGWRGGARTYSDPAIADRIEVIKKHRIECCYFHGSDHVQKDYAEQYPKQLVPSTAYIDRVVRERDLQTKEQKPKRKPGGSAYLLFPKECIENLKGVHESADFIGKKYIAGSSDPVNIFSMSYYRPFKLYQIRRVLAETSACAIAVITEQWKRYPIPNFFRLDNALQFRGTARGKRDIGLFLRFLLNLNVTPIFGSPSKPWTNPHIEGHNRVFNEKVWSNNWFTNLERIDVECERFNEESRSLLRYKYAALMANGDYHYLESNQQIVTDKLNSLKGKKIYFIRFVEAFEGSNKAQCVVLNELVSLPEKYSHQFVFIEWELDKEQLNIYSEYETVITLIKQLKFRINW